MKIVSPVYANMKLQFGTKVIEFKNGEAEVSDETFAEIQKSGFPNIFKKGEQPGMKTDSRKEYDSALNDVSEQYMIEIDRLKGIIKSKDEEIATHKQEVKNWKDLYTSDIAKLKAQLQTLSEAPLKATPPVEETQPTEELNPEEDAVRKELEAMKIVELKELAVKSEIPEEAIKKATTKDALINLIMGKTE